MIQASVMLLAMGVAVAKVTTRVPLRRRRWLIFMSRSAARMEPSIAASGMLDGVRRFL